MKASKLELRSEYESTYLAYVRGNDYLEFEEWLVKFKGYKPSKEMIKEAIIAKLIIEIRNDINTDWTVLDELLNKLPVKTLISALSDNNF